MTGKVEDDIDFSFTILGKWCCTERKYRKKAYHTVCVCVCVCVCVYIILGDITLFNASICYICRNVLKIVRKLRKIWTGGLRISLWVSYTIHKR